MRLQRRIVRFIVSVVVVSLLVSSGFFLISKQRSLNRSLEESARTFAAMVSLPLAKDVDLYRESGQHLLRQQVLRLTEQSPDLVRLQVFDVQGSQVMDASISGDKVELETFARGAQAPGIEDPELLNLVDGLQLVAAPVRGAGRGLRFRVVAPAVEEWGRHMYTLVAHFSYARASRELLRSGLVTGLFLALGVLGGYVASVLLAGTITRNVEKLQAGVQRVAADRFDDRVIVDSGDEIQELAESFNAMADRLQASISALRDAYVRLETLDQAKRNLLANVSHELKTPLTALRGYLELLGDGALGELEPGMVRAVEVCRRNVGRLTTRIEELVELARLDRDGAFLPMEEVSLGQLLHGVVETVWPRLEEKNLFCSLNLPSHLPVIPGNPEALERVFLNLLDNAVKFTPRGGSIRISADTLDLDQRGGVCVEVADTGVGIPEEQRRVVFDRFFQVDQSSRRRFGGMGLGLSLVQRTVELHDGSVWLDGEEGGGSRFFVWLPLEHSSAHQTQPISWGPTSGGAGTGGQPVASGLEGGS